MIIIVAFFIALGCLVLCAVLAAFADKVGAIFRQDERTGVAATLGN